MKKLFFTSFVSAANGIGGMGCDRVRRLCGRHQGHQQQLNCEGNQLTTLSVANKANLADLVCNVNKLTSLNVKGCSKLVNLECGYNQLTTLSVQGCTALKTFYCPINRIRSSGMTTLVGSLPTRSSSEKGELLALSDEDGDYNSMTSAQITTARNKNWLPMMWNGDDWVEMTASARGDVDGDGSVNISDVTALIDYLLVGHW